jgi:hypothetical protein
MLLKCYSLALEYTKVLSLSYQCSQYYYPGHFSTNTFKLSKCCGFVAPISEDCIRGRNVFPESKSNRSYWGFYEFVWSLLGAFLHSLGEYVKDDIRLRVWRYFKDWDKMDGVSRDLNLMLFVHHCLSSILETESDMSLLPHLQGENAAFTPTKNNLLSKHNLHLPLQRHWTTKHDLLRHLWMEKE